MSHSSVCKSHEGTSMMCFLNQVRAWHCFIVFTQCWLLPPSIIIKLMCLFWLSSTPPSNISPNKHLTIYVQLYYLEIFLKIQYHKLQLINSSLFIKNFYLKFIANSLSLCTMTLLMCTFSLFSDHSALFWFIWFALLIDNVQW